MGKFKRGVVVKGEKLYDFTDKSVTVVRIWPKPAAWRKTEKRGWRHVRPRLSLDLDKLDANCGDGRLKDENLIRRESSGSEPVKLSEVSKNENPRIQYAIAKRIEAEGKIKDFLKRIPEEIRMAIAPYPTRQWHLLSMTARCPGSLGMIQSNPALAFALASNWLFHKPSVQWPLAAVRRLIGERQPAICGWLGFPANESTVRILRKINPRSCSVSILYRLRWALRQSHEIRMFQHLPKLKAVVIWALTTRALNGRLTRPFLESLALAEPVTEDLPTHGILLDTVRMLRQMPDLDRNFIFRREQDVWDLHDRLSLEYTRRNTGEILELEFPAPPKPGNGAIEPIHHPTLLLEEGTQQENCVLSYAPEIMRGNTYIYRLTVPERATFSLVRNGVRWKIGEIAGKRNEPVSGEALRTIHDWFQEKPSNPEKLDKRQLLLFQ